MLYTLSKCSSDIYHSLLVDFFPFGLWGLMLAPMIATKDMVSFLAQPSLNKTSSCSRPTCQARASHIWQVIDIHSIWNIMIYTYYIILYI